jgi:hypothetical protein
MAVAIDRFLQLEWLEGARARAGVEVPHFYLLQCAQRRIK